MNAPRYTTMDKLRAVETAIVAFRWARNEPKSRAGETYGALKEIATELRQQLPEPARPIMVVRS